MPTKKYKKVNLTSSNLSEDKLAELRQILPEAFSENKIDWEKLRAVLGDKIDERIEKFSFTWAGRSNAIKSVLIPSKATLRPAKNESVKFEESENLFIEGDNLEVLKLLQKAYFEKVKMIYIDPPFNTGSDFVYRDDFAAPLRNYLQQTGQVDTKGNNLQTNRETSGRYHSDWLSMMYPRLKLAWNLLRDDGVIFVSIDDNEAHHLRMLLNEVFGEENFIAQFIWQSRQQVDSRTLTGASSDHEYILCYSKTPNTRIQGREIDKTKYRNPDNDPRGDWMSSPLDGVATKERRPNLHYTIVNPETRDKYEPSPENGWRFQKSTMMELIKDGRMLWPKNKKSKPRFKRYLNELKNEYTGLSTILDVDFTSDATRELRQIMGMETVKFPKPVSLVQLLVSQASIDSENDIILDFFAGSGTTAQAVLEQNQKDGGNRKFILVQLPELSDTVSDMYKAGYKTIADVAKERIRRVIRGYRDEPRRINEGFKVFKLTESNYQENQFEFDPEKSEEENKRLFADYLSKVKQAKLFETQKAIDVVYENIVKEGLSLNSRITEQKIGKNLVYFVIDGERRLLVCLDKKINEKTVSEITSKDYKGKVFICLDDALDDTAKANLGLNVELKTI